MVITTGVLWSDLVLAARQGGPARPGREFRGKDRRGDRAEDETAATAGAEINSKLQVVLNVANEGGKLEPKEIEIAKRTLLESRKYLKDFTEVEQCDYYLLSAWMNYFAGNYRRALGEANKASKANPDDGDATATQIALSMLNNEFLPVADRTKDQEEITIFGTEGAGQETGGEGHIGRTLDFNLNFIKGNVLGNKVSNLELSCLNGSNLSYDAGNETFCMIIWKTGPSEASETTTRTESFPVYGAMEPGGYGGPRSPGGRRGRTGRRTVEDASAQMLAFSDLFLAHYENPRFRFVGINLDSPDSKIKVMETLLESPWPWAQAMATDPANKAISQFAEMKIRQPTLVIAQPGGTVFYAGPASGFLPKILLNYVSSATESATGSHKTETSTMRKRSATSTTDTLEEQAKKHQDETSAWSDETEEDEINPHAENLYQMALVHQRSGRVLGYGRMVEYCRKIQGLYPDSPQAKKTKELLRQLPEKEQKKYKVTDEEKGL